MSKRIAEIGAVIRRFNKSYQDHSGRGNIPFGYEVDGVKIKFYVVGHNSSHEFLIGQNKEDVYRLAIYPDWDEENVKDATTYNVRKIDIDSIEGMYLGHYLEVKKNKDDCFEPERRLYIASINNNIHAVVA